MYYVRLKEKINEYKFVVLKCQEERDPTVHFSFTKVRINTPTFSTPVILHAYPPMKMEWTECSKMLAYNIQMLGNYPEESIQHSIHSESLKSTISSYYLMYFL